MDAVNNPKTRRGQCKVPFSRVLYIERDDFREDPPKQYFRLPWRSPAAPAYFIMRERSEDEETGEILKFAAYDPATRGGNAPDGRKVNRRSLGSAAHALMWKAPSLRFRGREPQRRPEAGIPVNLNRNSLEVVMGCKLEPACAAAAAAVTSLAAGLFLRRSGLDAAKLVFNRTLALRDARRKVEGAAGKA
jgi:glutaminyl-tRNA synthetase